MVTGRLPMRARDNPFRTEQVLKVRYRLPGVGWEDFLDRLAALDYRAMILGPQGAGKTTLLEDLAPRLCARGFNPKLLRLRRDGPGFPPGFLGTFFAGLAPQDVILFDGADHLGRLAWARFKWRSRRARGLIATSHGRRLLPLLIECSTSLELLEAIIEEIPDSGAAKLRPLLPAMFRQHQGNLRNALRHCYDLCAANAASPRSDA
jgi:hypothetical protein